MRNSLGRIALALGLVISSGSAHALNFCFNPGTSSPDDSLAVAEKFRKPAKGSCSPINGFDLVRSGPNAAPVTGTACLNSHGDTLAVSYLVHPDVSVFTGIVVASEPRHVSMVLPYPSLLNGLGAVSLDGSGSNGSAVSTNAHANSCIPPKPAIP